MFSSLMTLACSRDRLPSVSQKVKNYVLDWYVFSPWHSLSATSISDGLHVVV